MSYCRLQQQYAVVELAVPHLDINYVTPRKVQSFNMSSPRRQSSRVPLTRTKMGSWNPLSFCMRKSCVCVCWLLGYLKCFHNLKGYKCQMAGWLCGWLRKVWRRNGCNPFTNILQHVHIRTTQSPNQLPTVQGSEEKTLPSVKQDC